MSAERFVASVQYNDLEGTVAADRSDVTAAEDWLDEKGLRNSNEFLLGISVYVGENRDGTHRDPIQVTFLLATPGSYDGVEAKVRTGEPIPVREERANMNLTEFFGLFKRFEVNISSHGMLTEYTIQGD